MDSQQKICPIMGILPTVGTGLAGGPSGNTMQMAPIFCVQDRCALWDGTHQQCIHLTKTQHLEQINDMIFKLVKVLSEKGK